FGKRISKTVSGNTTYYYYSEDGLVDEADGIGAVTTSYHYQLNAPWGTDPMFIRQGGVYGYYITDHLGTPQRVVGSNGAVLWGAVYDAFGEAGIATASLVSNFRFPGQYYDSESGLHYNYFRYYDSGTGGYVSSDPIGLDGGINTYAYVEGNPVNLMDPLGLDSPGCDLFPDSLETSCRLECCAKHDECFDKEGCASSSWICSNKPCRKCNRDVVQCFVTCASSNKDDPNKPNYYCAKKHKYVRSPSQCR
ncbi:MAG: hypothetical protein GY820_28790, partial [Gammaproteobacteria bacterium]|nr:hypothetical protein [Gammaproteobacteria bacterium]